MKLRRTLFALVVLSGVAVLILGIAGVLSPGRKKAAGPPEGEAGGGMQMVIKDFKTEGENWSLHAKEARFQADTDSLTTSQAGERATLLEPLLEVKQPASGGEQRLTLRADEGVSEKGPEGRIHYTMSGHVSVKFTGDEKVELTTRSLQLDPDQGTGRTADEIELDADTTEGRQWIKGKGAEFVMKERKVVVSENIRMELSGGGSGLLPRAAETAEKPMEKPAATPTTKINCRGPATADGFRRTVELLGDVRVQQGENRLRAGRVEVQFAEKGRAPERLTAEGNVQFTVGPAEGDCDRLVRRATQDELLLEGRPARVRRGGSAIEAAHIELSGRDGGVVVPGGGNLKIVQETAGKPQEPVAVKWAQILRLDLSAHQALFRGDVRFSRGGQTIDCQMLTVKFDSENRQIVECRAETDVRLEGRLNASAASSAQPVKDAADRVIAQGKELVYDPVKDSVVLSGKASLRQERQTIRGERIEFHPADASIKVTGAGNLEGQAPDSPEKFSVSWGRDMQFSRASQEATFSRDVILKYAGYALRADNLIATLEENALKELRAKGGVVFDQAGGAGKAGRTLQADKLAAEIGADRKLRSLDASDRVVLQEAGGADHLSRTLSADRVVSTAGEGGKLLGYIATGHVVLREDTGRPHEARTMQADKVTATVDSEERLEKLEAVGRPVVVEQEGQVATGDRLSWDAALDGGTLFGSPAELRQGPSRLFGDQVRFSRKRGEIEVTSDRRVEASVVSAKHPKMIPLP